MDSSYSDEDYHAGRLINRSCNQKIQDDDEQTPSYPTLKFKTAKSQNELKKLEGEEELIALREKFKRNEEMMKKDEKEKNDALRHSNKNSVSGRRKLPAFEKGKDLVDSQEVSIEDSVSGFEEIVERPQNPKKQINQEFKVIEERRRKQIQHITFNIMVLGKSGVGKTSFIDCFTNKGYDNGPITRSRTQFLNISTLKYESDNFQVRLIDTPGYQELKVEQYVNQTEAFISKKLQDHLSKIHDRMLLRGEIKDERVHCCLFFLSGPWVCEADWFIMKKLQNITNLIPIVAKGDTFTPREIKQFKKKIFQKNKRMNVNWFSIEEILRRLHPQKLKSLLDGPFGKSPPFVITSCNEKEYNQQTKKHELVREFKWGKVQLNNESHNDFKFLKSLLVYYLSDYLIQYTEVSIMRSFQDTMIERRKRKRQEARGQPYEVRRNEVEVPLQVSKSCSQQMKQEGQFGYLLRKYLPIGLTLAGLIGTLLWIRRNPQS